MKKITILVIIIVAILMVGGAVAAASGTETVFSRAGKLFADSRNSAKEELAATYGEIEIPKSWVNYERENSELRGETGGGDQTDREIVDRIVEGLLLKEEGQTRGIGVTDEDVENLVQSTAAAYENSEKFRKELDDYLSAAGLSFEEYLDQLRTLLPGIILKQRVKDEIGREWCEANGYEFTKINPPEGMLEAEQAFIDELLEQHRDEITYFVD